MLLVLVAAVTAWCVACVCRTQRSSPLLLGGVRLLLPQPEFDYLAASARAAGSCVIELQGEQASHIYGLAKSHSGTFDWHLTNASPTSLIATNSLRAGVEPHQDPLNYC
jgi:hypothetical protein